MRLSKLAGALLALAAPPTLLASMACRPPAPPGTEVGTFRIRGVLEENTCGQGFAPPVDIAFAAELRRTGVHAYWKMGDAPRTPGRIDEDGDFRFQTQSQLDGWPADPDNGIPACRFVQTETIEGHLEVRSADADAGPHDAGLDDGGSRDGGSGDAGLVAHVMSATNTIEIGVVPGFDCSLALITTGVGGQFPSLPCHAAYVLEGASGE